MCSSNKHLFSYRQNLWQQLHSCRGYNKAACEDVGMAWDDSHIASHGQALKNILGQNLYFFAPSVIGSARGNVDLFGLDWSPLRRRRLLCKARCSRALNSCSTALTLFCIHLRLVVLSFQDPPVNEVITHQPPLSLNYKWVFVSTLQKEEVLGTPENNVLSPNLVSGLLMVCPFCTFSLPSPSQSRQAQIFGK